MNLERGRMGALGKDEAAYRRFEVEIAKEKDRTKKLYEGMGALLRELGNRALIRKAKQQQAMWNESGLQAAPAGSIGARIAAAIRGNS